MGCSSCSGGGCNPAGCKNNGACGSGGCAKLSVFNWLSGMESPSSKTQSLVEIRFKNTRKELFKPTSDFQPLVGQTVVVEATAGHDIGVISATGEIAAMQAKKAKLDPKSKDIKRIVRLAQQADLDKWKEGQSLEQSTMLKARQIAKDLKLEMKISDVEYQGDLSKATFFYTADDRVDFRELIRVLADQFKVRIEMRQIGARQEAGRLGGIGSCGRELCCSTWLTDFRSVSTSAARYQQLALNPLKLAGQCGKLKCCLNFELDSYLDALKDFPKSDVKLRTKKGRVFHQKSDIFKGLMWFTTEDEPNDFIALTVDRVKQLQADVDQGKIPVSLKEFSFQEEVIEEAIPDFENVVGQDDLTRFDRQKRKKKKKRKPGSRKKQGTTQPKAT